MHKKTIIIINIIIPKRTRIGLKKKITKKTIIIIHKGQSISSIIIYLDRLLSLLWFKLQKSSLKLETRISKHMGKLYPFVALIDVLPSRLISTDQTDSFQDH